MPQPQEVRGKAGQPIELPLSAGPATGYVWTLDLPAGVERIDDAPDKPVKPGEHLGASVGGNFRVTAPAGKYRITARLARPWEQGEPVSTLVIDLVVD